MPEKYKWDPAFYEGACEGLEREIKGVWEAADKLSTARCDQWGMLIADYRKARSSEANLLAALEGLVDNSEKLKRAPGTVVSATDIDNAREAIRKAKETT